MEKTFVDQIKEEATQYGKAVGEVGKLRMIGIASRVLGLFLLIFTLVLCVFALFTFGAVSAINAMSVCMPVWAASLIVCGAYIVLIIVLIAARQPLFIHPFIALLSKHMIGSQRELDMEILKAEHEVEKHHLRIGSRVESTVGEFKFIVRIITRIFHRLFSSKKDN